MSKVEVFNFKKYDISNDKYDVHQIKGTREAIQKARGTPIEDSVQTVDQKLLDSNGFYIPAK